MSRGWKRRKSDKLIDRAVMEERRKACVHALLNRPWISKEREPDLYYWIKDQEQELREWFSEHAGFPLVVTRYFAKLDKAPVVAHAWMGFPEFRDSLDYCLFTYGLWYLESKSEMDQFTLKEMVEEIRENMAGLEMSVDWKQYRHRQSMVRALKKLKELEVLRAVDGDEASWMEDEDKGNVLYEGSPFARYVLRSFPQDLTSYAKMEDLADLIQYPDAPYSASLRRRHRVYRRFLLEPAVLDRDWSEEDLYYVQTQRSSLIDQMGKMLGFVGRRYREGLLFFHPDLTGESELFPTPSAVSDLVLLAAGEVRRQLHDEKGWLQKEPDGTVRVTRSEMEILLLRLQERFREYWSKELAQSSSKELAERVFAHMEEWGLGAWEDEEHFLLYPVLGRWNAEYQSSDFVD